LALRSLCSPERFDRFAAEGEKQPMKTLILRMEPLDPAKNGYPISLSELDLDTGAVTPRAGPDLIPQSLVPGSFSNPLTGDDMHTRFAGATGPDDVLQRIGQQLYALIGQGQIGSELASIQTDTRVMLDIQDKQLQKLPWELLYTAHRYLFVEAQKPFCRGTADSPAPMAQCPWPLRLLIVVGSEPGDPAVEEVDELEGMVEALAPRDADVDLLVVKRKEKADVITQIREFQPHVFHFIGHGTVDQASGDAFLSLYNEASGKQKWYINDIRTDLSGMGVRLAFLNACRTAEVPAGPTGAPVSTDDLWSVADAFLEAGVPAVLGMSTDVPGPEAARFAVAFYQNLASGKCLDVAVAEARRRVWENLSQPGKRREWAAPCLQVRGLPEEIVQVGAGIDEDRRKEVGRCPDFPPPYRRVDQLPQRWQSWHGLQDDKLNLLVFIGENGVGKTTLARMVMQRCALCGHDIRHVDLSILDEDRQLRGDFLTVLRLVRDGTAQGKSAMLMRPLPAAAFAEFNRTVNRVLGSTSPPGKEDVDRKKRIQPKHYRNAEEICRSFEACLERSATNPPLVLVLDHLDGVEKGDFRDYLKPYLLEWCSSRPKHDVLIALLLTLQQYEELDMRSLETAFHRIPVDGFRLEDWEALAMEFARRWAIGAPLIDETKKRKRLAALRPILPGLAQAIGIGDPWKAEELKKLEALLAG
jgi:hypothetical protein